MSTDRVIGTSILKVIDGFEYLHIVCANGTTGFVDWACLPVVEAGKPNSHSQATWTYRRRGNVLEVQPSVLARCGRDGTQTFHNEREWSTPFVEVSPDVNSIDESLRLNQNLIDRWRAGERNL